MTQASLRVVVVKLLSELLGRNYDSGFIKSSSCETTV